MHLSPTWKYIWRSIKPFPSAIAVFIGVAIIWAMDLSLRPFVLKVILNRLSTTPPDLVFENLLGPIGAYLALYLILATTFRIYGYIIEIRTIPKMRKNIANYAFDRLSLQSHAFYQNHFAGSLASKVDDLARSTPELLQILFDRFFSHIIALLIAIYALSQITIFFSILMLAWTGILFTVSVYATQNLTKKSDHWASFSAKITGQIVDALSNILSMRLFAATECEKVILNRTFDQAVAAEQDLEWSYFWMHFIYWYAFVILQAVNFYVLCKGFQEGWITAGDFAMVLAINISIVEAIWNLAKDVAVFSKLFGRITQALREVMTEPEIQDLPHAKPLVISRGQITFENVQFHYNNSEALFQKKTITLFGGQKVGLVGFSGGGKSTFVNLILRLYDVSDGRIAIDGQDLRHITQASLRRAIGMIPQDPSLFHRTLAENIAYGQPDASRDQIHQAAKKAQAHDFIMNLPGGYEALVGERGVKLSGGQRQRIAIARALLKNAPILILDEATSQLDSLTEGEIQGSLWDLMQGKTTIVIAHRLSTLLNMDRILVFDRGTIVQDGSHATLLSQQGLYKKLWEAQVGGFIPESLTPPAQELPS